VIKSKWIKRRYLFKIGLIKAEKILTVAAAAALLLAMGWIIMTWARPARVQPAVSDISAFRIPYDSFRELDLLSAKYRLPFYELLTLYAQEYRFFPDKSAGLDPTDIEQKYILNYNQFKKRNTTKETASYEEVFQRLLTEMREFPIPLEENGHFVYSDSWGALREYGSDRKHEGTDILDRDNIRGRIPVVSMTDGKLLEFGWNELGGYHAGVVSESGAYYYYAHLDHFAPSLEKGAAIRAGRLLGYMGDTGYGKEGTRGQFPVHLHVGVRPKASFTAEEFWINPYPFLRRLEEKRAAPA
jgi:murein DD-endopeptidase MepM/ murein hydrolase activator NlpD